MYIVEWCDHEGHLQTLELARLKDAKEECRSLEQKFDGVCIKKK